MNKLYYYSTYTCCYIEACIFVKEYQQCNQIIRSTFQFKLNTRDNLTQLFSASYFNTSYAGNFSAGLHNHASFNHQTHGFPTIEKIMKNVINKLLYHCHCSSFFHFPGKQSRGNYPDPKSRAQGGSTISLQPDRRKWEMSQCAPLPLTLLIGQFTPPDVIFMATII